MRNPKRVELQLIKVPSQLTNLKRGMVKDSAGSPDLLKEINLEEDLATETETGGSMGPETGTETEGGRGQGGGEERDHLRGGGLGLEIGPGGKKRSEGGDQDQGGDTGVLRRDP